MSCYIWLYYYQKKLLYFYLIVSCLVTEHVIYWTIPKPCPYNRDTMSDLYHCTPSSNTTKYVVVIVFSGTNGNLFPFCTLIQFLGSFVVNTSSWAWLLLRLMYSISCLAPCIASTSLPTESKRPDPRVSKRCASITLYYRLCSSRVSSPLQALCSSSFMHLQINNQVPY